MIDKIALKQQARRTAEKYFGFNRRDRLHELRERAKIIADQYIEDPRKERWTFKATYQVVNPTIVDSFSAMDIADVPNRKSRRAHLQRKK